MARKNSAGSARLHDMLDRYGELCTQERAAFILGVTPRTVSTMLKKGKLRKVGCRVDVRSICAYIENPLSGIAEPSNLRELFFNASTEKLAAEA